MTVVEHCPPPLRCHSFPPTGGQTVLWLALSLNGWLWKGTKYNYMLPGEKLQELQTRVGT